MKKVLFGLMGLGLMILIASAYSITRLQLQPLTVAGTHQAQNSAELLKVEKQIRHLESELSEIETLEEKMQTAKLNEALSIGVQLNQKLKRYGSLATLQANLRLLNEMKADLQNASTSDLKTSTSENL